MKSIKLIRRSFLNKYNNFFISFFDQFTPLRDMECGYKIYKNCLNQTLIKKCRDSSLKIIKENSEYCPLVNFNLSNELNLLLLKEIIPPSLITIKKYLGFSAKLDYAYGFAIDINNPKYKNNSGLPHHDSVGNRIKIMIPISDQSEFPSNTFYIKDSNTKIYSDYTNNLNNQGQRIIPFWDKKSIKKLNIKSGGFYMIDTNGIHWGDYKCKGSSNKNNWRIMLVFEFSNWKSIFVYGKIGPRISNMSKKLKIYLRKNRLYSTRHWIRSRMKDAI